MPYSVSFIPEAAAEYKALDGSVRVSVAKRIDELEANPFLGHRLGNRHGMDLSGFFKLYAHHRQYRIVYRLLGSESIEVIEIWGLGKREKEAVYRALAHRLRKSQE